MSKRETFIRNLLVINLLRRRPATFKEILQHLITESRDYSLEISKRTFQRDLNDISSIYNIVIKCNSLNQYYIEEDNREEANERIFEAFNIFNAFNMTENLSEFIQLEKRKPQGTENLSGLLHAVKNKLQITITYQKYWDNDSSQRVAEPYALKEFKKRWYVIAKDLKDNRIKTFALDRLTDLETSKKHFQTPEEFNIEEYFKHCFGIISPDNEDQPEEVILSFDAHQGKYIKSLPFHESQEIVEDNEDELIVKMKVYITHDFVMEVLSYGERVKVIKPERLIKEIKGIYADALNQY